MDLVRNVPDSVYLVIIQSQRKLSTNKIHTGPTDKNKKLSYRRDTAQCVKRPFNVTQGHPLCQLTQHMISY